MPGLRFLCRLGIESARRPILSIACAALLALLSLAYAAHHLRFQTGRNDLVSRHQPYVQRVSQYEQEFEGLDELIVVIGSPDPKVTEAFADRLAEELLRTPPSPAENTPSAPSAGTPPSPPPGNLISRVFYRFENTWFHGKKLLLLGTPDLQRIRDGMADHLEPTDEEEETPRYFLQVVLRSPSLDSVLDYVNRKMKEGLIGMAGADLLGKKEEQENEADEADRLSFLTSLLRGMNSALKEPSPAYHSPWGDFFGAGQVDRGGYLTTEDRQYLVMQVRHVEGTGFLKHAPAVDFIRKTIVRLRREFPGVDAGVTGGPALSSDEMTAAQRDTGLASILSFVGVLVLFQVALRELKRPLLVAATLLIGVAWSLGFATLTVGHLSILTVTFVPMLIGLGDDFGFHLLMRYEEERTHGLPVLQALETTVTAALPGLIASGVTTVLAFFAIMLVDFRGIQELGWISGWGMVFTFFSALLCVPALLALSDRKGRPLHLAPSTVLRPSLARFLTTHPLLVLGLAAAVSAAAFPAFHSVTFDYNLLHLQSKRTESVEWEYRILESSKESSWYALATADSPEDLRRKVEAFKKLPTVSKVRSVLDLVPPDQPERLEAIRGVRAALSSLGEGPVRTPDTPDVRRLLNLLDKVKFTLRKKEDADTRLNRSIVQSREQLLALIQQLQAMDPGEATARLARYQQQFFRDLTDKMNFLRENLTPSEITMDEVPPVLRDRFVSRQRPLYLMRIYPSQNIWEREPMLDFAQDLRSVDPDVTGAPIIGCESIGLMKESYVQGGLYAAVAILLVVLLKFRRFMETLLVILPVVLGALWTVGLMRLFHVQFNLANLVVVPLIIGIGVEGGIHMVDRVREEGTTRSIFSVSTPRAIALVSTSTMIGFGSLMIARHYGIFSLGLLLTIAVACPLVVTLIILPVLLHAIYDGPSGRGGR